MNVSSQKQVVTDHTEDQLPHICLMTVVMNSPLMTGHTFAEKDTMMIRIGEEAKLHNIRVKVLKSCKIQSMSRCLTSCFRDGQFAVYVAGRTTTI